MMIALSFGCKEKSNSSIESASNESPIDVISIDTSKAIVSERVFDASGQYVSKDNNGAGYYKVMLLSKTAEGDWNVDIKVKKNGDKKVICDFKGKGYFKNRDLIVPLKEVNSSLKGALKIRFVDLMAIVYTEDVADNKEMIFFCKGEGSIAGNFKKTDI